MPLDFILIIPVGLAIQLILLFKRGLLIDKFAKKWIWILAGILFVLGLMFAPKYENEAKALPFLMLPLLSFTIFNILLKIYRSLFHQDPVDTFYSMDLRLMRSGLFNFTFWVLGLMIPVLIIYTIIL